MKLKRKYNGKEYELSNLTLWENAAIGKLIRANLTNQVGYKSILDVDNMEAVREIIELYIHANNELVYPLGSVESDIKYHTIASYIISEAELMTDDMEVNINNGINIKLNDEDFLNLAYGTYVIKRIPEDKGFKAGEVGLWLCEDYQECDNFKWALDRLIAGQSLDGYYMKYEPELYEAYNGDIEKIKEDCEDILSCKVNIPNTRKHLNCLTDSNTNALYQLLFFPSSKFSIDENDRVIDSADTSSMRSNNLRSINCFNYSLTVYKDLSSNSFRSEKEIMGVIEALLGVIGGKYNRNSYECRWFGFMGSDYAVFEISNEIYVCPIEKYKSPLLICKVGKLLSVANDEFYIEQSMRVNNHIVKKIVTKQSMKTSKIEVLGVEFVYSLGGR